MVSNADINFGSVCVVFAVFSVLLVLALISWWKNKKGIVRVLNLIQIFVEWASYGLNIIFHYQQFQDFTSCSVYRWSINIAFHYGFCLAIEVLLVMKARALYPDSKSSQMVVTLCYTLVAVRAALSMWTTALGKTTLTAGSCYTAYDAYSNLVTSLFRASVELFISMMFVWPIVQHIRKLKRVNEEASYTVLFYTQLLKDGVIYPMVTFTANVILNVVLTYNKALGPLTQCIFAISNVITCASIYLMTTGVQRAAESAQSRSSENGKSTKGNSSRAARLPQHANKNNATAAMGSNGTGSTLSNSGTGLRGSSSGNGTGLSKSWIVTVGKGSVKPVEAESYQRQVDEEPFYAYERESNVRYPPPAFGQQQIQQQQQQ
ncbi:hypothetical protein HK101_000417, partial [Irineochytrium annulatum]